jgi:hypothetical protein
MKCHYITGAIASIFAVTAMAAPNRLTAKDVAIPEMTRYYDTDVDEIDVVDKRHDAVPEMTRYYDTDVDDIDVIDKRHDAVPEMTRYYDTDVDELVDTAE